MNYLFGFGGRINRAKMWLFILITLAWELVIGIVAMIGLDWTQRIAASSEFVKGTSHTNVGGVMSLPGPIDTPKEWATAGIIAVLVLLYVVALFAVYTKRLHDRNKNAWWLVLFLVIPWGAGLLDCVPGENILNLGEYFGPLGVGLDAARLIAGVLAIWAFFELFVFRGTHGENRYGPDPLA